MSPTVSTTATRATYFHAGILFAKMRKNVNRRVVHVYDAYYTSQQWVGGSVYTSTQIRFNSATDAYLVLSNLMTQCAMDLPTDERIEYLSSNGK